MYSKRQRTLSLPLRVVLCGFQQILSKISRQAEERAPTRLTLAPPTPTTTLVTLVVVCRWSFKECLHGQQHRNFLPHRYSSGWLHGFERAPRYAECWDVERLSFRTALPYIHWSASTIKRVLVIRPRYHLCFRKKSARLMRIFSQLWPRLHWMSITCRHI